MSQIHLRGMRTTPMIAYLKALGLLRVISRQVDSDAKGHWSEGHFVLDSSLDRESLIEFLLRDFSPSPFFGPWGGRSGLWPNEKGPRKAMDELLGGDDPRFDRMRRARREIEDHNQRMGWKDKPEKAEKHDYIIRLRSSVGDDLVEWIDTCQVIREDDVKEMFLLGTGGNEGSGSYFKSYLEALLDVTSEEEKSRSWLESFMDGNPIKVPKINPGQLMPFSVSNFSATDDGRTNESSVNPWDLIMALEGAVTFSGSITKRARASRGDASFPFMTRSTHSGSHKVSEEDGEEFDWEFWLPVWPRPSTYDEIQYLCREGRAQVGRREPNNGLDFARAIGSLRVDRGIESFTRYGRLQRNGKNSIAVPLDSFKVRRAEAVEMLDDLDPWLSRLQKAARSDGSTATLRKGLGDVENAIFSMCKGSMGAQAVIRAIGRTELSLSNIGTRCPVHPIQRLGPEWMRACDDDSSEFILAASLANMYDMGIKKGDDGGSVRKQMEPVTKERGHWKWCDDRSSVVWGVGSLEDNLMRVLERRLVEASMEGIDHAPLDGPVRASLSDIKAFIERRTDDRKISELMWGLIGVRSSGYRRDNGPSNEPLPLEYRVLKSVLPPGGIVNQGGRWALTRKGEEAVRFRPDPGLPRKAVRDVNDVLERSLARLHSSGLRPISVRRGRVCVPNIIREVHKRRRVTAALLFPIWEWDSTLREVLK